MEGGMRMADREKVIKAYEDFVNGYECFCTSDDYEYEMHKAVLALLKEQEAVEPLTQNSNGWVRTIKLWYCGACHSKISRRTSKYCPNCGKPILWEGRCSKCD